jgi:hypothetical protein
MAYEPVITDKLKRLSNTTSTTSTSIPNDDVNLDVKYCLLREDLLIKDAQFVSNQRPPRRIPRPRKPDEEAQTDEKGPTRSLV